MSVNTNKPLHVSVLFIRPSSGGHMPCFVPLLLCLPLICVGLYNKHNNMHGTTIKKNCRGFFEIPAWNYLGNAAQ
jgi:hypothetical protein